MATQRSQSLKRAINSRIDRVLARTPYGLVRRPILQHKIVMDYFAQWSSGILHLGGHLGHESTRYAEFDQHVIWVEAIPDIAGELKQRVSPFSKQRVVQACITDRDGDRIEFKVSGNHDGVSSSIFDFGPAASGDDSLWPDANLHMVDVISLETTTIDRLFAQLGVSPSDFNHWIVDLQGAELLALKGGLDSLKHCRSLVVETSTVEVYEGGAQWLDVKALLEEHGFVPAWEACGHMDVLFLRTGISSSELGR
jgi:FkbM family methyltransferase